MGLILHFHWVKYLCSTDESLKIILVKFLVHENKAEAIF